MQNLFKINIEKYLDIIDENTIINLQENIVFENSKKIQPKHMELNSFSENNIIENKEPKNWIYRIINKLKNIKIKL